VLSFQSIPTLDRTTEPPRSRDKRPLCKQCKKRNGPIRTPLPLRDPRPRHMMNRSWCSNENKCPSFLLLHGPRCPSLFPFPFSTRLLNHLFGIFSVRALEAFFQKKKKKFMIVLFKKKKKNPSLDFNPNNLQIPQKMWTPSSLLLFASGYCWPTINVDPILRLLWHYFTRAQL
jgi:hypothetical protein